MRGKVFVVTGKRGAGKSRCCERLLGSAEAEGLKAGGIISPAVYENGIKTAFYTMDVRTREKRLCGMRVETGASMGCWQMDPAVLAWGDRLIAESCPCDVLFIDELGPLEFEKGEGYASAFEVLRNGSFQRAYVVIRPECVQLFRKFIPEFEILSV